MFRFILEESLQKRIKKIEARDKRITVTINKKIKEIINNDNETIDRYKNLKYELHLFKRVHIDKSFVLIFAVEKDKNLITFLDLNHHDDVYK
jgi:YafQ family addiction module toxin component